MNKPTVEQVEWVFKCINDGAGGSFRNLIYNVMDYKPEDYAKLYRAGGMNITNAMTVYDEDGE